MQSFLLKMENGYFKIQICSLLQAFFLKVRSLSHTFLEGFAKVPHAFSKTILIVSRRFIMSHNLIKEPRKIHFSCNLYSIIT